MRVIGLTGGIASGKSTVGHQLASLASTAVIDADVLAHEVMAPGGPAYAEVVDYFGSDILTPEGTIDRPRLGAKVFGDPEALHALNARVHPHVRQAMQTQIDAFRQQGDIQTVFLMIPLLYESKLTHLTEEVWVVYCSPAQQLERLIRRNALTHHEAQARLAAQWPIDQKRDLADWVIDNSQDEAHLKTEVNQALQRRILS